MNRRSFLLTLLALSFCMVGFAENQPGRPALAMKLVIQGDQAKVTVAFNYLTKPEDSPKFIGARFYTYDIQLNAPPQSVGWSPNRQQQNSNLWPQLSVLLNGRRYVCTHTELDRAENGSFRISSDKGSKQHYHIEGVYSYFGQIFVIDAILASGEPLLLFEKLGAT